MANIWGKSDKVSKKEVRQALMLEMTYNTDNRFTVGFASDDGGHHAVCYAERDPNSEDSPFKDKIPSKFMGWRVLFLHVPDGYIDVFFESDGTKRETKSYDE